MPDNRYPDFGIFVSYSHDDGALLEILKRSLQEEGLEAVYDRSAHMPAGSNDRFEDLRGILARSGTVIVILTDKSIDSPMCRDEWVMAQQFRIPLLVMKGRSVDIPDDAKYLLNAVYTKTWLNERSQSAESFAEACAAVTDQVVKIANDPRHRVLHRTGKQLREIDDSVFKIGRRNLPKWRVELMQAVITAAAEEVEQLGRSRYEQNLSIERDFIVRALPIFRQASRIYATSLEDVSTFWLSDEQKESALAYAKSQPPQTTRLFVFDGPASAHRHLNVLATHHETYGEEGCVLLCDRLAYERLMDAVFEGLPRRAQETKKGLDNADFAFLYYDRRESEALLEATLSGGSHFTCKEIPQIGEGRKKMIAAFDELHRMRPGDVHAKYGILRWDSNFVTEPKRWKRALETTFINNPALRKGKTENASEDNPVSGDVWHLVFFAKEVAEDPDFTRTVREQVNSMRDLPRAAPPGGKLIKEVLFANWGKAVKATQANAIDGRFGGRLITESQLVKQYPFCVLMRFERLEDLDAYYNDYDHAECRRKIFEAFPPQGDDREQAIRELFKLLQTTGNEQTRKLLYKGIEGLASRHMQRIDFVEQVDLNVIVEKQPPTFGPETNLGRHRRRG